MPINNAGNAWNGQQFTGSIANVDKPYVSGNRPGGTNNGTNTASLIQSTSLLDQRDIYKQLVDLQDDAEWLDFMWMAGKKKQLAYLHISLSSTISYTNLSLLLQVFLQQLVVHL